MTILPDKGLISQLIKTLRIHITISLNIKLKVMNSLNLN